MATTRQPTYQAPQKKIPQSASTGGPLSAKELLDAIRTGVKNHPRLIEALRNV